MYIPVVILIVNRSNRIKFPCGFMKISYFRNKADKAFQQWFMSKNPKCEVCGKGAVCGHHYISKAASSALRYYAGNMIPVCMGCHCKLHSKFAPELNSEITLKRGKAWFKQLQLERRKTVKVGVKYYKEISYFCSCR